MGPADGFAHTDSLRRRGSDCRAVLPYCLHRTDGAHGAVAADGYLVAALRHPGDNWQDNHQLRSGNSGILCTARGPPAEPA